MITLYLHRRDLEIVRTLRSLAFSALETATTRARTLPGSTVELFLSKLFHAQVGSNLDDGAVDRLILSFVADVPVSTLDDPNLEVVYVDDEIPIDVRVRAGETH